LYHTAIHLQVDPIQSVLYINSFISYINRLPAYITIIYTCYNW